MENIQISFNMDNPLNESIELIRQDLERFVGQTTASLFPLLSFIQALDCLEKEDKKEE